MPGLKLAAKYLGPYEIVRVLRNDRYNVRTVGEHEGPFQTSSAADYMKPWINDKDDGEFLEVDDNGGDCTVFGSNTHLGGRVWVRIGTDDLTLEGGK